MPAGHQLLKLIFLAAGTAYALVASAILLEFDPALSLAPWLEGRLSRIFMASVCAAFASGSVWVGLSGRFSSSLPSLIGLSFICVSFGSYLLALGEFGTALPLSFLTAAAGAMGLAVVIVRRRSEQLSPQTPRIVLLSCVFYSLALAVTGILLLLRSPGIFPWPLAATTSIIFGFIFIGLSCTYAMTAYSGRSDRAMVVMLGFLAYDLVLLPPFLRHVSVVTDDRLLSLLIYLGVLFYSLVVSLIFLIWRHRSEYAAR